jgi:hypothetical protein
MRFVHLTADIYTRTGARQFFFLAWASAPHLGTGRKGMMGRGIACVFALCLILYLGWEHVFGGNGMLLLLLLLTNSTFFIPCIVQVHVQDASQPVGLRNSRVFLLPWRSVFQFLQNFLSSVQTDIVAEKSESGYGLLLTGVQYIVRQLSRVQREVVF